jgi:hypothetical protein
VAPSGSGKIISPQLGLYLRVAFVDAPYLVARMPKHELNVLLSGSCSR